MHPISVDFVWNHGRKLTQEILQRKGQTLAGMVLYRLIFRLEWGGAKHPLIQTERRVEIGNESRRGRSRLMPRCVHGVRPETSSTGATNSDSQPEFVADGGSTRRGVGRKGEQVFVGNKVREWLQLWLLVLILPLHSGALVLARNELRSFQLLSPRLF